MRRSASATDLTSTRASSQQRKPFPFENRLPSGSEWNGFIGGMPPTGMLFPEYKEEKITEKFPSYKMDK